MVIGIEKLFQVQVARTTFDLCSQITSIIYFP